MRQLIATLPTFPLSIWITPGRKIQIYFYLGRHSRSQKKDFQIGNINIFPWPADLIVSIVYSMPYLCTVCPVSCPHFGHWQIEQAEKTNCLWQGNKQEKASLVKWSKVITDKRWGGPGVIDWKNTKKVFVWNGCVSKDDSALWRKVVT